MSGILDACRVHETTFTPLLIVVLMVTFAEVFPQAKWLASGYSYDMSPYAPNLRNEASSKQRACIVNAAGGFSYRERLDAYRRAAPGENSVSVSKDKPLVTIGY